MQTRPAIAAVRQDKGEDSVMSNFESAAACLLPSDPVAKKRTSGTERGQGLVSESTGEEHKETADVSAVSSGEPA